MRKLIFFIAFIALIFQNLHAQVSDAQSMFIYNFCRLIEWPQAEKQGDFVIGVLGNSEIYGSLEKYMTGKKVGVQPITIQKFSDPEDISKCHILFISYGKSAKISDIQSKISNQPCLLIGEKQDLIDEGAAINFVIVENKLKFQLNADNAEKQNLKVSQNLVNMASL